MQINISDEMIEKMVKEQVKSRINQYISDRTKDDPYWLFNMCRASIGCEISKIVDKNFVQDTCRELSQNYIAEKIVDRFAEKIANCFEY